LGLFSRGYHDLVVVECRARLIALAPHRRKADPLRTFAAAVTHARAAHSDRTDAGHDLTLGQMPVAHQSPAAIIGELVGMAAEHARNLSLNGLGQKRSRATGAVASAPLFGGLRFCWPMVTSCDHAVGVLGSRGKARLVAVFCPHMDAEVHAGRVKPTEERRVGVCLTVA
jgi:hypothetical protein